MPPLVSVMVPHFETRPEWLVRAVQSMLEQSLDDIEVLIADDASSNDSWRETLRHFAGDPRLRLFRASRNVGPYRLKTRLLEHVRGHYVAFQDADDWSLPERLELQVAHARSSGAGIVGSSFFYVDEDGGRIGDKSMVRRVNFWLRLRKAFVLLHSTCLVDTALMRRLGGFDGEARVGGDDDFMLRAVHATKIRNLPEALYAYRKHDRALTTTRETGRRSSLRQDYIEALLERDRARWWGPRWISRASEASLRARPVDIDFALVPVEI